MLKKKLTLLILVFFVVSFMVLAQDLSDIGEIDAYLDVDSSNLIIDNSNPLFSFFSFVNLDTSKIYFSGTYIKFSEKFNIVKSCITNQNQQADSVYFIELLKNNRNGDYITGQKKVIKKENIVKKNIIKWSDINLFLPENGIYVIKAYGKCYLTPITSKGLSGSYIFTDIDFSDGIVVVNPTDINAKNTLCKQKELQCFFKNPNCIVREGYYDASSSTGCKGKVICEPDKTCESGQLIPISKTNNVGKNQICEKRYKDLCIQKGLDSCGNPIGRDTENLQCSLNRFCFNGVCSQAKCEPKEVSTSCKGTTEILVLRDSSCDTSIQKIEKSIKCEKPATTTSATTTSATTTTTLITFLKPCKIDVDCSVNEFCLTKEDANVCVDATYKEQSFNNIPNFVEDSKEMSQKEISIQEALNNAYRDNPVASIVILFIILVLLLYFFDKLSRSRGRQ